MMVWIQFAICGALIFFTGSRLSHYGELIADKTGFSKNWVGSILLAVTASSSQLVASISAAVFNNLPDMAVGGLMGSCMFDMLIIGLLDLFSHKKPMARMVHHGQILSAGFAIVLLAFSAIDILFGKNLPPVRIFNLMDPITLAFIPLYLIAMRLSFRFERTRQRTREQMQIQPESNKEQHLSWLRLVVPFAINAVVIFAASSYLPILAEHIQEQTGWGQSFIGISFIAVTTCLPELAVSVAAAKRRSFEIAVGSLLGSTLCYMVILAITDFCYGKGPLLRQVSSLNALAALTAIISMAIVIIALTYRAEKKFLFIAGDALGLLLVYLLANVLLFIAR